MPETRSGAYNMSTGEEIEQLRQQIAELQNMIQGAANVYHIPDPIKQLPEYSGNKKELNAWLQEVDELYEEFKVKGENGAPDTFNTHYFRAIKNKLKGDARTIVCANGNPNTILSLKRVLQEHFGDERDFVTNLNFLFHLRKGDKTNTKFYNDIKELNTKLKSNLQLHPMPSSDLLDILTVTKFLDGVSEPLASIIRNSKPKNLEDAYQSVVINQNAEVRKPQYKPKSQFRKPESKPETKPFMKNVYKKPFPQKPRVEVNNNELDEETEEETEEMEKEEEVSECDDLNFQEVRMGKRNT